MLRTSGDNASMLAGELVEAHIVGFPARTEPIGIGNLWQNGKAGGGQHRATH
jgi:hypothetical protein